MAKILIVDDEELIRDVLTRLLTRHNYTTCIAADGVRAIIVARQEQPDLILMDMGLPLLNGWQATQRLRTFPETQHTPIIALTAYVLPEERARTFAVGCNAFVPKPIDMPQLLAQIESLLSTKSTDANAN